MRRKQTETETELTEGYTAGQAATVMSNNSGKTIGADYVRKLAKLGLIRVIKVNARLSLYNKEDVGSYIVEDRGVKAGRAIQSRTAKKAA